MLTIFALWIVLCLLSFGLPVLRHVSMKNAARKPWRLEMHENYFPNVSILLPTYNESKVIGFKLKNLNMQEYPSELMEILIVDSNSDDETIDVVDDFIEKNPSMGNRIKVLSENDKKGKSAALNLALQHSQNDIVIVSDADCFWPPDILAKSLPFLSDGSVGAISGPKILLNPQQSWVTRAEDLYLNIMNRTKLGESKTISTPFFEGGFSAFKRGALTKFDPYSTGSDDCGTVLDLLKRKNRAILVPEARFYTTFPMTWRGRMSIKIRRANQLVRVFSRYLRLMLKRQIKTARGIILQNCLVFFLCPVIFALLLPLTFYLLIGFPLFALLFLGFLIPKVRVYLFEAVQNYTIIFLSLFSTIFKTKSLAWKQPEDRLLLTREMLQQHNLI